jgi:hypothetical protein
VRCQGCAIRFLGATASCLALAACGGVRESTTPLSISQRPLPPVSDRQVTTRGTIPHVEGRGLRLSRVNRALLRAVLADERRFAASVRSERADPNALPGLYRINGRAAFLSANSVVVSMLVRATAMLPGLNGGQTWFAATVLVPSGKRVELLSLLRKPMQGLDRIAATARRLLTLKNSCVRTSVSPKVGSSVLQRGFSPTFQNYRYFAFLPQGLVIGFGLGQVAFPPCLLPAVTVPYSAFAADLNAVGKHVVASVRTPR